MWPTGNRVLRIHVQNLGLKGPLPQDFNHLTKLSNLGFRGTNLVENCRRLRVLSLDGNLLNKTEGWLLPTALQNSVQLQSCGLAGDGLSGPIDVIASMTFLSQLWLHGNQFTGTIPAGIGSLPSLTELDLSKNNLMGAVPKLSGNFSYANNSLSQSTPGVPCAPQVTGLINFLGVVNYPSRYVSSWKGNDQCGGSWLGITYNSVQKNSILNLPNDKLNVGTILKPLLPPFNSRVKLVIDGNPLVTSGNLSASSSPDTHNYFPQGPSKEKNSKKSNLVIVIVTSLTSFVAIVLCLLALFMYCLEKRKAPLRPRAPLLFTPENHLILIWLRLWLQIVLMEARLQQRVVAQTVSVVGRVTHVVESWKLVIQMQILCKATENFAPENELGRGSFGEVYKGEMEDGSRVAVKRMEGGIITSNTLDQFQSETVVLSKVSDFGLVKLIADGLNSVTTRVAGTFGYLAPEYAATGKVTTKADVFSYSVVLMELITGLTALDVRRCEDRRNLASWFWQINSSKERLMAAVDKALHVNEETLDNISIVAELARHCTASDPSQRPEMGHAVNVLSQLGEKWKPHEDETEEYPGIDFGLPLTQMIDGWQEAECDVDLGDMQQGKQTRKTHWIC
ncbi:hypothetical protein IFM89_018882 [Coptis chinensis]|uniref:Protein kinase domain-containing protein n=1 Tax=Coptis chinensis TaxID=261450 RepID=A0A835HCN5_9MAGN|nr:hypothetical protein IFM89_018882 [Coptis chinensis]